jgi:L-fuculose-phosphate aldolase
MPVSEGLLRAKIIAQARAMNILGINQGTSGNVSARCGATMLITPTATPYEALEPAMIAQMKLDGGAAAKGPLKPSSEWRFHRDIYLARSDAGAVVHTHSTYATARSMLRLDLRATHYMIAAFGGVDVRCTGYAPYGTQELSDLVIAGLRDRSAVLLGSHGAITIGRDLDEAMWRAVELETLCKQTWIASQAGTPVVLDDDEVMRTVERFKGYGVSGATPAKKPSPAARGKATRC